MSEKTSTTGKTQSAVSAEYAKKEAGLKRFVKKQNNADVHLVFEQNGQPGLFINTTGKGLTITKLADFFKQGLGDAGLIDHVPTGSAPINLPLADEISLQTLSLTENKDLDTFDLNFTLRWSESVTHKVDEGFELRQISLTFNILGKDVSVFLDGILAIHDVELEVSVAFPSFMLQATLTTIDSVPSAKQTKLVNNLIPTSKGKSKKQSELRVLTASASLRQKRFMLYFEVIDLLDLDPFELKLLMLDMTYAGGTSGTSSQKSGRLYSEIDIELEQGKPIAILLTAELNEQSDWFFEGSLGPQGVAVGTAIETIADKFSGSKPALPAELETLEITQLDLKYDTGLEKFDFTMEVSFDIEEGGTAVDVLLVATNKGNLGGFDVTGQINIGRLLFTLELAKSDADKTQAADTYFVATYSHTGSARDLDVTDLLGDVDDSLRSELPDIKIDLKDLLLAFTKQGTKPATTQTTTTSASKPATSHFIVGADLAANFDLSNIPLVGKAFPPDQSVGIRDLKIVYASADLYEDEVSAINALLPATVSQLPDASSAPSDASRPTDQSANGGNTPKKPQIKRGLTLGALLDVGGSPTNLSIAAANSAAPGTDLQNGSGVMPTTGSTVAPTPDSTTWIEVQKGIGPIYFEKIGVDYVNKELWFRLNGSLTLGGFTLALEGLSVGSPITRFAPSFDLQGLGIDIQQGPIEIGGMFLRFQATAPDGTKYDEYDGTVVVKTPLASISAIGSYARFEGHPSLFMYAVIEGPIGGPVFFYVTGLAAGFGYNRNLIVPPVTQILQFPLVAEALGNVSETPTLSSGSGNGSDSAEKSDTQTGQQQSEPDSNAATGSNANIAAMRQKIMAEIEGIRRFIPPEVGQTFFAIGVKYTTFELLDSFALVTVAFGNRFELNIIGITAMSVPPGAEEGVPALILIEVAIGASYKPDEGFLGVMAVLTSRSHLLDPNCHLTGGMAYYNWFSGPHGGEFVITVGGYHPKFKVPSYYPRVPRLGLSWVFNANLSIKGGSYFALTGHVLMAGGFLRAVWESGSLKAWIKIAADFLLTFKPFHYTAEFSVDIGAQVTINFFGTHHLSIDLNADLKIWGPSFTGKATIHIWIASFSISFGSAPPGPPPIDWPTFRTSFLPSGDENILTISAVDGLISTIKGWTLDANGDLVKTNNSKDQHLSFNAKHFAMATNCVIPVTQYGIIGAKDVTQTIVRVGVAPMDVRKDEFESEHRIKIERIGRDANDKVKIDDVSDIEFTVEAGDHNKKAMPVGLWGNVFQPNVNSHAMIDDVIAGITIKPKLQGEGGRTQAIPRTNLSYDTEIVQQAFTIDDVWTPTIGNQISDNALKPSSAAQKRRDAMLTSFMDASEFSSRQATISGEELLANPIAVEIQ